MTIAAKYRTLVSIRARIREGDGHCEPLTESQGCRRDKNRSRRRTNRESVTGNAHCLPWVRYALAEDIESDRIPWMDTYRAIVGVPLILRVLKSSHIRTSTTAETREIGLVEKGRVCYFETVTVGTDLYDCRVDEDQAV